MAHCPLSIPSEEWKFEGSLYVPVGPGCSPEAQWCRAKYDMQKAYYQLVIKVPGNAKGVELKSLMLGPHC